MDEKRKGEIAYLVLKVYLIEQSQPIATSEFEDLSKKTGVSQDELREFQKIINPEVLRAKETEN